MSGNRKPVLLRSSENQKLVQVAQSNSSSDIYRGIRGVGDTSGGRRREGAPIAHERCRSRDGCYCLSPLFGSEVGLQRRS